MTSMKGRVLVDTNVLVYAYDRSEREKQAKAIDVLDRLAVSGEGAVSTQILAEFFVAITGKISHPLTADEAFCRLENYARSWTVLDVTSFVLLEAARGVKDHQLSFWDAQVWATARLNQIPTVLSEDFVPGSVIDGVLFVNPFAEGSSSRG